MSTHKHIYTNTHNMKHHLHPPASMHTRPNNQMDKDTYVDIMTTWVKWVDRNRDKTLHVKVQSQ